MGYSALVNVSDGSPMHVQVNLTTFDTASELGKLARWHPGTRALLRIRADDPAARCQLGNKYGAEPADATALLQVNGPPSRAYI